MARGTAIILGLIGGLGLGSACSLAIDLSDLTGGLGGQSTSPPAGGGGSGGTAGGGNEGGSGGVGGPQACVSLTECPVAPNPCEHRVCIGLVCGTEPTDSTKLLDDDVAGDCQRPVCDGDGNAVERPYPDDLPVDGNECTDDLCSADGVPSNPPHPAGTSCGPQGAMKCNGSLQTPTCVECILPSDCPGQDDECHKRTCSVAGACGFSFTALGGTVIAQVSGDCHQVVCDGNGGTTTQADDLDLPVDGNPCTADLCSGGTPSNPANVGDGCGLAGVCNALGQCVGCNQPSDCGSGTDCMSWECPIDTCLQHFVDVGTPLPSAQQVPNDCLEIQCNGLGGEMTVPAADGPTADGEQCTDDQCVNGSAQFPPLPMGASCTEALGQVCNGLGACVGCNSVNDCAPPEVCHTVSCLAGQCTAGFVAEGVSAPPASQTAGDCQKVVCDGQGGTTAAQDPNDLPIDGNDCTTDLCDGPDPMHAYSQPGSPCPSGVCDGQGSCVQCLNDSQCVLSKWCRLSTKTCQDDLAQGDACLRGAQCPSGNCVDGVCCNIPCGGVCRACSGDKTGDADGTCTYVAFGTDPDGECQSPEVCGTGICCQVVGRTGSNDAGPQHICEPP